MNRLKELRNQRKLTLDDIEAKTGIKRGTYSNYENNKTEPKIETWQKLANFFKVSVPYIQGLIFSTNEIIEIINKKYFEDALKTKSDRDNWFFSDVIDKYVQITSNDLPLKKLYKFNGKKDSLSGEIIEYWFKHFKDILIDPEFKSMKKTGDNQSESFHARVAAFRFMICVENTPQMLKETGLTTLGAFYKNNFDVKEEDLRKETIDKISYYDLASAKVAINDYYELIKEIKEKVDNFKVDDGIEQTYKYIKSLILSYKNSNDYEPGDDKYISQIIEKLKHDDIKFRDYIINHDYESDLLEVYSEYLMETGGEYKELNKYLVSKYEMKSNNF